MDTAQKSSDSQNIMIKFFWDITPFSLVYKF
jgi:hypothetical protein